MAAGALHAVTVLEQCDVSPSPPPAATQPRSLPLTFFDLVFWGFPPVQRLFFYDGAYDVLLDVPSFVLHELPRFKSAFACALHHFYPLAGKIACEMPEDAAPEIVFTDGDSVQLIVAASQDDFYDLAGDHARDTARLRPLLPPLPEHGGSQDILAVQVTVFPGAGICIGTTLHHGVADGASYAHFITTWAAIHRCRKVLDGAPPLFDRSVVADRAGLREVFIRDHRALAAAGDGRLHHWDLSRQPAGVVLATFRFTDELLRRLGRRVESETSVRCSPSALACGTMWTGIVHARCSSDDGGAAAANVRFGFVTGCKPRAKPPIPANYFGNCLGLCRVEAKRSSLTVAAAAKAIWRATEALVEEGQVFREAAGWVRCTREYAAARALTVAGSPKLGVYTAAEFGSPWGRPMKLEIVSVERTGALALAESGRDGDGGVEVGGAAAGEMEAFQAFYRDLVASLTEVNP